VHSGRAGGRVQCNAALGVYRGGRNRRRAWTHYATVCIRRVCWRYEAAAVLAGVLSSERGVWEAACGRRAWRWCGGEW